MELYFFLFIKNVLPPVEEAQNSSTFHWCTKRGRHKITATVLCLSQIQEASEIGKYIIPNFVGVRTSRFPVRKTVWVITIYKPWLELPSTNDWIPAFNSFINLKNTAQECAVGLYDEKAYNSTTHLQPKQTDLDHSKNAIQKPTKSWNYWVWGDNDESDELNIRNSTKRRALIESTSDEQTPLPSDDVHLRSGYFTS
jgi:hypothetical protein